MYLSKSKYCLGVQCPKILWMDKNMPEQKAEQDQSRFEAGNMVGDLAMGYFGAYTEVPFCREDKGQMLSTTQQLIEQGTPVIAEASFSYDGNFCSVDLLKKGEGGYEIVEVKSSSGEQTDTAGNVKVVYLDDMAYQYYVLTHAGLPVTKVSLMRLNKNYERQGDLDLQQLFVLTDCTELVKRMQDEIPARIDHIKQVATQQMEPQMLLGRSCDDPYPCAYHNWCFRNLPQNNVFDIGFRFSKQNKEQMYRDGIIRMEDVLHSNIRLSHMQHLQIITALEDAPPHVDREKIQQFLDTLHYPLYHLDFETYQQVVPLWDGVKPYEQIPFQYSLHIQQTPCGEAEHKEYLAQAGEDCRRELAERLCADIPRDVCVLAFNAGFEKSRIQALANRFADLRGHLMDIRENFVDLAMPFSAGHYYARQMGGSYSIKVVLPAICGGDPDLDYNKLESIHNGSEAMAAFASLHEKTPEEIAQTRTALLAYCKLDTLAMVKILERLYAMVQE
ncbi:DUF2779 domain-containing protein [Eubacteriales bacterium OttesenSCG-928-N14]|nr:DUF2779 domain-containing protein [Eubacteriales bacterium OttesenSCG-928-N14]